MKYAKIILGLAVLSGCSADTFTGADGDADPDVALSDASGDEIVSETGSIDSSFDAGIDVSDAIAVETGPTFKRVFITSARFGSNFGGLAAADTACASAVSDAGLGGTWKAWLSTSNTSAASRLSHASVPYQLVNGTQVAANWNAIVSGFPLQSAIDADEHGNFVPESPSSYSGWAWTGTSPDGGTSVGATCADWTVVDSCQAITHFGETGSDDQTSSFWTARAAPGCCVGQSFALYCFEQ